MQRLVPQGVMLSRHRSRTSRNSLRNYYSTSEGTLLDDHDHHQFTVGVQEPIYKKHAHDHIGSDLHVHLGLLSGSGGVEACRINIIGRDSAQQHMTPRGLPRKARAVRRCGRTNALRRGWSRDHVTKYCNQCLFRSPYTCNGSQRTAPSAGCC